MTWVGKGKLLMLTTDDQSIANDAIWKEWFFMKIQVNNLKGLIFITVSKIYSS